MKGIRLIDTVSAIPGDNLGSHGIGGFVENFSKSNHVCRFCLAEREELFSSNAVSGIFAMRTPSNYNSAVSTSNFDSLFNDLQYFHVCGPALPPCLAHDLFEGVVSFDLSLYNANISQWTFPVDHRNNRIYGFPFKQQDLSDRPSEVNLPKKTLGDHAVQNWNMIRFLLGLVKNFEDEVWQQILLLSEIVQLVTAPAITPAMIMRLQDLIEDYVTGRAALFPNSTMKPKHHYLLHYPFLIMQFGPLVRMWTMRCESKHSYFRKCAINCQNFKNLTLTLSQRHQLFQAYQSTGIRNDSLENPSTFVCDLLSSEIRSAVFSVFSENDISTVCSTRKEWLLLCVAAKMGCLFLEELCVFFPRV